MKRLITAMVLFCFAVPGAQPRFALLVGSNEAGPGLGPLKYAELDARRFADILTSLGRFEAHNVKTVLKPDSAVLEQNLREMVSRINATRGSGDGALFLLYYSGHADSDRLLLGGDNGYSLRRIHSFLDSVPAAIKVAVFDACQSGTLTAFRGGKRGEPFYFQSSETIRGQVIIASSSAHEKAQESEALKGSVFSHHLFNGLRGSADVSGDRRVTLNEAYQYAYRKTLETTALTNAGIQHPVYRFNIRGQGDIVLTDLSRNSGGVLLAGDTEGKFLVTSEDYGSVYAEFFKRPGRELYISLSEGAYTAICASGDDVTIHSFSLASGSTYRLNASLLRPTPLQTARLKGALADEGGSEHGRPLSAWSVGLGLGGTLLHPGTDEYPDRRFSLALSNRFYLNDKTELSLDLKALLPGITAGVEAGFERALSHGPAIPFFGAGAGIYVLREAADDNRSWGPGLSLRWGLAARISARSQIHVQIPYTAIVGADIHHALGLEVRWIVHGPHRNVRTINP